MADDAFRQRPGQPQPFPSEGEVGPGLLAARHVPGHGQYLEATVEQDRMRLQAASVHRRWQHDFPDRLAVTDPCRLKRAEPRAEVDADVRPRTVERRDVLRRQACLQRGEVDSGRGLSLPAGQRRALRVQRPAFFTLAPAVYLEVTRRRLLRCVQDDLDPPALASRCALCVLLGEDQRAVQLQVLHDYRFGLPGERGGHRHRPVQRTRCDDTPEDAVVAQPGRVCREHLRLERGLASRRIVPDAQQRMARGRPAPPRRIDPVRLALERVTGQRDPPSRLSREQSWERERDAGLVRCGDPLDEPAGRVDDRLVRVARRPVQAGQRPPGAALDSGQARLAIGPSTACGPSSTTASTPISASVSTHPRNATGCRACRRQYAASCVSPGSSNRPETLLTSGMAGDEMLVSLITAARSSSAGSTSTL